MKRVGVVGSTGYAGAELVRILSGHPDVRLTVVTSRQYSGICFSEVYPALSGFADIVCEDFSPESICEKADVIFLALPHKLPMNVAPSLLAAGKTVIDLSADFRFSDADAYEAAYQPHTSKALLERAVYGLSEIYADEIRKTDLIGNPGCYPTSVLLPLIPLVRAGILDLTTIVSDSKSGVSGAGRSLSLGSHFSEVNESFKAYKAATHRHNPEMNEILSKEAGGDVSITFVPHLIPVTRGMLTTTYARLNRDIDTGGIHRIYKDFYRDKAFVRIYPEGRLPDISYVRGTNFCDIGFSIDSKNNRLILVSAIDNLVKGAAGQAVQNMNIILGIDEKRGLFGTPYPL